MRKIMFVLILLLVAVMIVVIPVFAGNRILCHKDNGHGKVEMWLSVNENAVQAHLNHGDTLWPQVTVCGGVEIPYTPTPEPSPDVTEQPIVTEPVATEPVIIPTVEPTEEPIIPQPSLFVKLFLPIIRNECLGWPFCTVPQGE